MWILYQFTKFEQGLTTKHYEFRIGDKFGNYRDSERMYYTLTRKMHTVIKRIK